MQTEARLLARFGQLTESGRRIPLDNGGYIDQGPWHEWLASAIQLVTLAFGEKSPHALQLKRCAELDWPQAYILDQARGTFAAAKSDYEGGYLQDVRVAVSGEVLGDLLKLSKAALDEGHHTVAAVLACAALEDALKRYASTSGLDVNDAVMQQVVNALKAAGLVSGAQKSLLDTMPKIRDHAMHANWDKLSPADVGGVTGFVEQFLLTHF